MEKWKFQKWQLHGCQTIERIVWVSNELKIFNIAIEVCFDFNLRIGIGVKPIKNLYMKNHPLRTLVFYREKFSNENFQNVWTRFCLIYSKLKPLQKKIYKHLGFQEWKRAESEILSITNKFKIIGKIQLNIWHSKRKFGLLIFNNFPRIA